MEAFIGARELVEGLIARGYLETSSESRVDYLLEHTPWLFAQAGAERPVRHNLDESFRDQLVREIGGQRVEELILLAPFHDEHGVAAEALLRELSPAHAVILRARPRARLLVRPLGPREIVRRVERCSDDAVDYIELFDDEFFVLLPRTHELANRRVVRIEQLRDERILGSGQPWAPDFRHLCASAAFDPRLDESYRGTDFPAIQALVAAGNFVSLIPGLALSLLRDDVVVRPLDRPLVRHVAAATPRSAYRPPAAEAMIEVLREVAPLTARATATARTHAV